MEKKEVWTSGELRKEELRGVFALGVIASLVALRFTSLAQKPIIIHGMTEMIFQWLGLPFPEIGSLTWADIADGIIWYWLGYVMTASIALVDDFGKIFRYPASVGRFLSRVFYGLGVFVTSMYGIFVFWSGIVSGLILTVVSLGAIFVGVVGIWAYRSFRGKGGKKH